MVRVKRGVVAKRRHKKILKQAKGFYGARSSVYRVAKQGVIKSGQYAYRDRKVKKRLFRSLWIVRINAAVRPFGLTYGTFISYINKLNSSFYLNRKMLAEVALNDKIFFKDLVDLVKLKFLQSCA